MKYSIGNHSDIRGGNTKSGVYGLLHSTISYMESERWVPFPKWNTPPIEIRPEGGPQLSEVVPPKKSNPRPLVSREGQFQFRLFGTEGTREEHFFEVYTVHSISWQKNN